MTRISPTRPPAVDGDHARDIVGLKVFSATTARARDLLSDRITGWICNHPQYKVFNKIVTQSSDAQFHCLTITLLYRHART